MKKHFFILFVIACVFGLRVSADAQSCTAAVCNAASPNRSDVIAALPSSSNSNATVVVNIPAGTGSWTTGFSYTVPSAVTNLTIQGATSINWSGTAGTSSYTYSTSDGTIIQDSYASNNPLMVITINGPSTNFRMTGLTIQGGSSASPKFSGVIQFAGSSTNFRFDHNHLNNNTYSPMVSSSWVRVGGSITGVMDHNVLDLGDNTSVNNAFQAFNTVGDNIGLGDGTWAKSTGFGTNNFLFFENNFFNGGAGDDCYIGGRFVMRYNTINNAYVPIQEHPTKSSAGAYRGCRAYEAYYNYIEGSTSTPASGAVGSTIGTALIWGNTLANGYYRFFESQTPRNSGSQPEGGSPPNFWGYCGTAVNSNGVGSGWDGNQPSSSGYPCLDGLGRGQDTQPLNGQWFPGRLNSVTGQISWPHQYLEPIYLWNNSVGNASYVLIQDSVTTNNRDYYYDCGPKNNSCSGGFNGTAGTGYGKLANRPSTCTSGLGGTYFTSPTGSYGVAYFATDANAGNGELYVCTSTNSWTGVYQPYTYPHPLVSGDSTKTGDTPPAPTGLVATVN